MDEFQHLSIDGSQYETRLTGKYARRKPYAAPDPKRVHAAIPGVIERVLIKPGQRVRRGDILFVLEAMKMKNPVTAVRDGSVRHIHAVAGKMVAKGELLVEME